MARDAIEGRRWAEARQRLTAIAPERMAPEDWSALATASYLVGDRSGSVAAMQRAFQARSNDGDVLGAVSCAAWIAMVLITDGDATVGGGWVARARRLFDSQPDHDVVERGYLLIHTFFEQLGQGDLTGAVASAVEILGVGQRFGDPDLVAMGLVCQGRCLLYGGRVPEGLALLDEAMVGVAAAEVSPIFAGQIYCAMIEGCQEIADFARVEHWTSALTRWCSSQPDLIPFTGQCALHRAQVLRFRGAFTAALEELDLAQARYRELGTPAAAGLALCERGDLLRIRGAHDEADAAYEEANRHGYDPQPGLALLWLARGRATAAAAVVRRLLAEASGPVARARLLPAAVEVLVAVGDPVPARAAAEEMAGIASSFGCAALLAAAAHGAALADLAEGDAVAALAGMRQAWRSWTELDCPYEAARARVGLGRALAALGDEDSATAELRAAQRSFHELGAAPAEHDVEAMLRPRAPAGLTSRQVEVLRLVARGKTNAEIAADLVLSEKTVARHLSNIFTKIDVSSRTAAAAYAFEHRLT